MPLIKSRTDNPDDSRDEDSASPREESFEKMREEMRRRSAALASREQVGPMIRDIVSAVTTPTMVRNVRY